MIELGESGARGRERSLLGKDALREPREDFELERERAVCGLSDARLERGKLGR